MRNLSISLPHIAFVSSALLSSAVFANSGVFDGSNADVWVIDSITGQTIELNANEWLLEYQENGVPVVPVSGSQQAIINNLPRSSTQMQGGQPSISIADLGSVGEGTDAGADPDALQLLPAAGSYTQTIEIQSGVIPKLLDSGAVHITLKINGDTVVSYEVCNGNVPAAECRTLESIQNGYLGIRRFIADDGNYDVEFSAKDASGSELGTLAASYSISSDHEDGRFRDTDNDGIPDLIEAEAGMNPLADVAYSDADADGWSDLDEWLRGSDGDSGDSVPADADGDGWADFDEQLRGTNPNDVAVLLFDGSDLEDRGESLEQKAVADHIRRFKHFPNAGRLYEVEFLPKVSLDAGELDGKWVGSEVFRLNNEALFVQSELLTAEELAERQVNPNDINMTRQLVEVENKLQAKEYPPIRLAAGLPGVLIATFASEATRYEFKAVVSGVDDVELKHFNSTNPAWSSVAEWKAGLIAWLADELVLTPNIVIDQSSTVIAAALEQAMSDEAALSDAPAPVLYGTHAPTVKTPWLTDFLLTLPTSVDGRFAGLLQRLATGLSSNGFAEKTGEFIAEQFLATPEKNHSDLWLRQQFSEPVELPGCFIFADDFAQLSSDSEQLAEYKERCPEHHTDEDLRNAESAKFALRYRLRWLLLEDSAALNPTVDLQNAEDDADADFLTNRSELFGGPLTQITSPRLFDTDEDTLDDFVDPCPLDTLNLCVGEENQTPPTVTVGAQVSVEEQAGGNVALIAIHLSRPAPTDVILDFQAVLFEDDTADSGRDFAPVVGQVVIAAGEQLAIIAVPVNDDAEEEEQEQFSLEITDLQGALSAIENNRIIVQIENRDAGGDSPPTAIAQAPNAVNERQIVSLNGEQSSDDNGGLNFSWTRVSGPEIVLRDADQARAEFDAPETLEQVTIELRLTVTDSNEQTATDLVSILINPVDDAPEVIAELDLNVVQGQVLAITNAEILANVREPDGESLSVDAIVAKPQGASVKLTASGVEVRAFTGAQAISSDKGGFESRAIGDGKFVFVETGDDFDSPQSLFLYDQATDTTTLIHTTAEGEGFNFLTASTQQPVVYWSSGFFDADTFQYSVANGVREVTGFGTLSGSGNFINEASGDLYLCDDSSLTWKSIDADTLAVTNSTTGCESSGSDFSVQFDGRLCVNAFQDLSCSNSDGTMSYVLTLAYPIAALFARGSEMLAILQNFDSGNVDAVTISNSFTTSTTTLADIDPNVPPVGALIEQGSLIFAAQHFDDSIQLYGWAGSSVGSPTKIGSSFTIFEESPFFVEMLAAENTIYWLLAGTANGETDIREFAFSSAAGVVPSLLTSQVLSTFDQTLGDRVGTVVLHNDLLALPLTDPADPNFSCKIVGFDRQNGGISQLETGTGCTPLTSLNSTLLYSVPTETFDFNTYHRRDGTAFTGDTGFAISVSDENGNATNLPASLSIEAL